MANQNYVEPAMDLTSLDDEFDVLTTSDGETKPTGGGGGIVLPDDEW